MTKLERNVRTRQSAGDSSVQALQALIDSGSVWGLEGSMGREAMRALETGVCFLPLVPHRDYWGNTVPARSMLKPGTKGTLENAARFYGLDTAAKAS